MPDFPAQQMANDKDVQEWLKFFEMKAPIVCASVFHSYDPGYSLRMEHTHCYSEHGDSGHYHDDTTPDEVEYEGYFVPAETIYRIDQVSENENEQPPEVNGASDEQANTFDVSFTIDLKETAQPNVNGDLETPLNSDTKAKDEQSKPPAEVKTAAVPKPKSGSPLAKVKSEKAPTDKTKVASTKVAASAAKVNGAVGKPEKPILLKPPKAAATSVTKDETKPKPRAASATLKTKEPSSREPSKEPPKRKLSEPVVAADEATGEECPKSLKKAASGTQTNSNGESIVANGSASAAVMNGAPKPPTKERRQSPVAVHTQEVVVKMPPRPTVSVTHLAVTVRDLPTELLQHAMSFLSYDETTKCRLVNRQFDAAAGERLSNGYRTMVKDADSKLNRIKKQLPFRDADRKEHQLQPVFAALTSFECFVLNPVDAITPAMDEGVCCFPYGLVLDAGFSFLRAVENAIRNGVTDTVDWKYAADLSRVANGHYKRFMAPDLDRRLGDVFRMKAAYRLQKFDSWMVETTVNNLERAASIAREDFNWEIDQLRTQNQQLKKENRDLRHDYMKLEARVEMLESKFKTIGRLFQ
jgi:hypothetical protein